MRDRIDRLQKLEDRQRRLRMQIDREKAVQAAQERKRDARRKILVGAMVLGLVERGEWPRERLLEKLDQYLTRNFDRALFDLPALSSAVLWKNIVIDGALEPNGMIGWSQFLTPEEAELIRAYVVAQARVLQQTDARAPLPSQLEPPVIEPPVIDPVAIDPTAL